MLGLDHETVLHLLGELRGSGSHEAAELCEPVNDDDDEEDIDEDDFDNEDDDGDNCEEVCSIEMTLILYCLFTFFCHVTVTTFLQ